MAGWRSFTQSDGTNFLTLDAVPIDKWSPTEANLLERALASRHTAAPDASIHKIVDDILVQVQAECASSPVKALRLALCVLRHTHTVPCQAFALGVIAEAGHDWWLLVDEEQKELYSFVHKIRAEGSEDLALMSRKVLDIAKDQELLSHLSRPEFSYTPGAFKPLRALGSPSGSPKNVRLGQSLSSPSLRLRSPPTPGSPIFGQVRRADLPKKKESVYERENFPKDPPSKPIAWWNARQVPWLQGQPVFAGQQFAIQTPPFRPVGRMYFEDYSRCHPSSF
mmetsp:Transcript_87516/g.155232  ORF Transcript_87516/g.155232 Transcript_87516/m.155232 type:complete len:280 (-) Transcript_87516:75-914(-)|eukprot:CAMPEP_0197658260 /NCGR_PEP_ID=MMETSP1338-20131121/45132_1 /TAXON_ID=43686 ORGANISM="Pelagodinium beii, Strain RCC1491" /NCGR_SAMPLE_ID=MMETSP1338 /ASSEMBLY_ACC=CAM_ASM_000754 /LENGTH=279 /DNA_ID=CAMNT_0043234815 /DNA_START=33 /DNA_END=872 /DNA_ORIENTATION=-